MSDAAYRNDLVYMALEQIVINAGIKIEYLPIPDDCIYGEILARSNEQFRVIQMPDTDTFDSDEQAALVLGHEAAHILTSLDSPDYLPERIQNEDVCDYIGKVLYKLAEMTASTKIERETFGDDVAGHVRR